MPTREFLTIAVYIVATTLVWAVAGASLLLLEDSNRGPAAPAMRLVASTPAWLFGIIWMISGVVAISIAFVRRARPLALAVWASFLATAALLYTWANAVAFVGGGAWDQLRVWTGGGFYPLVAVVLIVGVVAVLTLVRGTGPLRRGRTEAA